MQILNNSLLMERAFVNATYSNCKSRKVGSVLYISYKDGDYDIIDGYNYSLNPKDCCKRVGILSGIKLDECYAVHSEQVIISKLNFRKQKEIDHLRLYITAFPCQSCLKLLILNGVDEIYYKDEYTNKIADELIKKYGVKIIKC